MSANQLQGRFPLVYPSTTRPFMVDAGGRLICSSCKNVLTIRARNTGLSGPVSDILLNTAIGWACPGCGVLIDLDGKIQQSDASIAIKQVAGAVGDIAFGVGIGYLTYKLLKLLFE